jgi:hypothetical protein
MRLDEAIAQGEAIQKNARGPKAQRQYQKIAPPANPVAQSFNAPPVPIDVNNFVLPQRPTPAITVGVDSLKQFNKSTSLPQRRAIGPNPL